MAQLAKAPVSKTGDSRFESWLPRLFIAVVKLHTSPFPLSKKVPARASTPRLRPILDDDLGILFGSRSLNHRQYRVPRLTKLDRESPLPRRILEIR